MFVVSNIFNKANFLRKVGLLTPHSHRLFHSESLLMCNQLEIRTVNNMEFQFVERAGNQNRPISHGLYYENT